MSKKTWLTAEPDLLRTSYSEDTCADVFLFVHAILQTGKL